MWFGFQFLTLQKSKRLLVHHANSLVQPPQSFKRLWRGITRLGVVGSWREDRGSITVMTIFLLPKPYSRPFQLSFIL